MIEQYKKRLLYAAGKYSDYSRYFFTLDNIEEEYSETLEIYNYDMWLYETEGTILDKAQHMLKVTKDIFLDLRDNAERELYHTICEIAELDEQCQQEICGGVIQKELFSDAELEDKLMEWDNYEYTQQGALNEFLDILRRWNVVQ